MVSGNVWPELTTAGVVSRPTDRARCMRKCVGLRLKLLTCTTGFQISKKKKALREQGEAATRTAFVVKFARKNEACMVEERSGHEAMR